MTDQPRDLIVTAALPYANGSIHIGHLLGYIQTDIWVRFQRLRGHKCTWVWADDAHGTPIMLKAAAEGVEPLALIERMHSEHETDFRDFLLSFDNFYSTHSPHNRQLVERVYHALKRDGHIEVRTIKQLYDPERGMFLPDRYVLGTCPMCDAPDQYGDHCELCAATYDATELKSPRSTVSDAPPELRDSEQYFFKLSHFEPMLRKWTRDGHLQSAVANKLQEWFDVGLKDWDISRNAPYWGFEIPDAPGKYFYVWLDAPVGYMASHLDYCERHGLSFEDYWHPDTKSELYNFIGKDIAYFHTLFWPSMLQGAGFRTPNAIFCNGFLTVNGTKMSKSRGTFITARAYLDQMNPEYLRYYFATKLSASTEDIDLNLDSFIERVNADLVGKLVNIASRCQGFIHRYFDGVLAEALPDPKLYQTFCEAADELAESYENLAYHQAIRRIMELADTANRYITDQRPWVLVKNPAEIASAHGVCTQGLNLFRVLMVYLQPVVPDLAARAWQLFNLQPATCTWDAIHSPLLGTELAPYEPLMVRVESASVQAMLAASSSDMAPAPSQESVPVESDPIDIAQFGALDMRVAQVVDCTEVEGSDKLLCLQLDDGSGRIKQVFSGIRAAYRAEDLRGRQVIFLANLQPRKMRFGLSEGMVLCAASGDQVYLLDVDQGAKPGMRVS